MDWLIMLNVEHMYFIEIPNTLRFGSLIATSREPGIYNCWQLECLSMSMFRLTRKCETYTLLAFYETNPWSPVVYHQKKGRQYRKRFHAINPSSTYKYNWHNGCSIVLHHICHSYKEYVGNKKCMWSMSLRSIFVYESLRLLMSNSSFVACENLLVILIIFII